MKYDTKKQGALDLSGLKVLVDTVNSELKRMEQQKVDGNPQAEAIPAADGKTAAEAARLEREEAAGVAGQRP